MPGKEFSSACMAAMLAASVWAGSAAAAGNGYQQVVFPSSDGTRTPLNGLVFRPSGQGPFGAVVGIHGCNGLYEGQTTPVEHYVSWARLLQDSGYVVLLIDGLGSRGIPTLCGVRGPSPVQSNRELVSDAFGALAYLQSRSDVNATSIALVGWSMGADAVLWTIARESALRPVNLPRGDFRAAIAFYPGGCPRVLRETGWTSALPLLLQLGAADDYTPPQPCVDLAARARALGATIDLDLYPGAYHLFDHPDMPAHPFTRIVFKDGTSPMIGADPVARAAALERIRSFLKKQLQ